MVDYDDIFYVIRFTTNIKYFNTKFEQSWEIVHKKNKNAHRFTFIFTCYNQYTSENSLMKNIHNHSTPKKNIQLFRNNLYS